MTRTTTQTTVGSGTSTSRSVAGYFISSTPSISDGAKSSVEYDSFGRQTRTVDLRGRTAQTIYNNVGQVTSSVDHAGKITTYTYYPATHQNAGMLEKMTDPLGRTTAYTYNARGQVLTSGGTAGYLLAYIYTSQGEVATLTTTNEQGTSVTQWEYHPKRRGLLTKKTYSLNDSPEVHTYNYHPFGHLDTASSPGGNIAKPKSTFLGRPQSPSRIRERRRTINLPTPIIAMAK